MGTSQESGLLLDDRNPLRFLWIGVACVIDQDSDG
jgi:hypothetical protein